MIMPYRVKQLTGSEDCDWLMQIFQGLWNCLLLCDMWDIYTISIKLQRFVGKWQYSLGSWVAIQIPIWTSRYPTRKNALKTTLGDLKAHTDTFRTTVQVSAHKFKCPDPAFRPSSTCLDIWQKSWHIQTPFFMFGHSADIQLPV